jgi:diadenosine tetraphosphate (Ap4A) HIT family hydrolase
VTTRLPCCATWDANQVIAETPLMRAVLDGYPVTEGHALVYPRRHIESFVQLNDPEILDLHRLIRRVCQNSNAFDHTIAVNDGQLAGRTVPHLHVHVIPRRAGDVADPRGGVRRLLIRDPGSDPWLSGKIGPETHPASTQTAEKPSAGMAGRVEAPTGLLRRFRVYAVPLARGSETLGITHDDCPGQWTAEMDDFSAFAELVQRASEHAEVCR